MWMGNHKCKQAASNDTATKTRETDRPSVSLVVIPSRKHYSCHNRGLIDTGTTISCTSLAFLKKLDINCTSLKPSDISHITGDTTELKDVAFANKFMPRQAPTTTGNIEANYATLVNHNFLDETKPIIIKTEDYHSEQGAIKIIAKIKVTYSSEIEYQTKIDCGFNALQIQGQSEQLSQTETNWHASAVPEEYFNFNRPRLLTMYGVGLSYNHNEETLQVEDNPQRMEPPRLPQVNIASSLSEQLAEHFDPDTTPATNNALTTAQIHDPRTSTPKTVPFRYKRKSQPPKPTSARAKRLKTKSYGDSSILVDSTGTPIFPNYYRVNSETGTIAADTDLDETTTTQVISGEQNARDQNKDNDPLDDPSGLWKPRTIYGASDSE